MCVYYLLAGNGAVEEMLEDMQREIEGYTKGDVIILMGENIIFTMKPKIK